MENEILDSFEEEKPDPTYLIFLQRVNLVVGILTMIVGCTLIYSCYYWYDVVASTLIPLYYIASNYELLSWLIFGALFLHGGFRIIRKEKLGIEIIYVVAIAMITFSLIIVCFGFGNKGEKFLMMSPYLILSGLLLAYSKWKNLSHLYLDLSLSSYLWLVGIIVGIIPFIFFWEELFVRGF